MIGASAKAQPVNPIIISRFILVPPPLWQVLLRIISSAFAMLAEQRNHRPFRTVAADSWNSAALWNLGGECFDGGRPTSEMGPDGDIAPNCSSFLKLFLVFPGSNAKPMDQAGHGRIGRRVLHQRESVRGMALKPPKRCLMRLPNVMPGFSTAR